MLRLWPRFHRKPGPFVWSGKRVPEFGSRVGCTFRLELQTESASRNPRLEWDALSGTALNRKLRPRISIQSGMPFPAEPSGGKFIPELTLGVGHSFRMEPQRKLRPSLSVYSGMQFPLGASAGKRVPFWALIPGHGFRLRARRESRDQFELEIWDALSAGGPAPVSPPAVPIRADRRPLRVCWACRSSTPRP